MSGIIVAFKKEVRDMFKNMKTESKKDLATNCLSTDFTGIEIIFISKKRLINQLVEISG